MEKKNKQSKLNYSGSEEAFTLRVISCALLFSSPVVLSRSYSAFHICLRPGNECCKTQFSVAAAEPPCQTQPCGTRSCSSPSPKPARLGHCKSLCTRSRFGGVTAPHAPLSVRWTAKNPRLGFELAWLCTKGKGGQWEGNVSGSTAPRCSYCVFPHTCRTTSEKNRLLLLRKQQSVIRLKEQKEQHVLLLHCQAGLSQSKTKGRPRE